ncbi:MAG: glycosyltransferase [Flavobacteriales bacterium]
MHILIISNGYPGFYQPLEGIFYLDQAKSLHSIGHQVGYLSVNPISLLDVLKKGVSAIGRKSFNRDGVDVELYSYINVPKNPTYDCHKAVKKGKIIFKGYTKKFGLPDLVHLHGFDAGLLAIHIKKTYNIPFVLTEHSSRFILKTLSPKQLEISQIVFNEAKHRIAVSEYFKQVLEQDYSSTFEVIPNIVDTDFFVPPKKHSSRFKFLCAGTLNDNKNQILAIRSFHLIHDKLEDAVLTVVGSGENMQELKTHANELGLSEKVEFLGQLSREEIRDVMQNSFALLITSKHETFGVVAIEAMSCGLPVISTPCGGPEKILHSECVLSSFDIKNYADSMLEMYNKRTQIDRGSIRKHTVNNFSVESVATNLVNLYLR